MEHRFRAGGKEVTIRILPEGEDYRVEIDGREHHVRIAGRCPGSLDLEVDGRRHHFHVAADGARRYVAFGGRTFLLGPSEPDVRERAPDRADRALEAEMPGVVRAVHVSEGDRVERGQTLVVLEAMKMEIRITAPHPARIRRLRCQEGEQVERGQVLVELAPP